MSVRKQFYVLLAALVFMAGSAFAQDGRPSEPGIINFLSPPIADPQLSHAREIYVLYGCAYCHGVDLKVRNGEAADLLHSGIVGADVNANLIGGVLHSGIPQTAKLSPMPQFSDLSDQEISAIARWIHYARQQGRYKELMEAKNVAPGNVAAGKAYADKTCASCHAEGNLSKLVKAAGPATLKAQVLHPAFMDNVQSFKLEQLHDTKWAAGRQQHGALLENYSKEDVANLMAYLQSLK